MINLAISISFIKGDSRNHIIIQKSLLKESQCHQKIYMPFKRIFFEWLKYTNKMTYDSTCFHVFDWKLLLKLFNFF